MMAVTSLREYVGGRGQRSRAVKNFDEEHEKDTVS